MMQGTLPGTPISLTMTFNCQITNFAPHTESAHLRFTGTAPDGTSLGEQFGLVEMDIQTMRQG
jgi:hypothetical protein